MIIFGKHSEVKVENPCPSMRFGAMVGLVG